MVQLCFHGAWCVHYLERVRVMQPLSNSREQLVEGGSHCCPYTTVNACAICVQHHLGSTTQTTTLLQHHYEGHPRSMGGIHWVNDTCNVWKRCAPKFNLWFIFLIFMPMVSASDICYIQILLQLWELWDLDIWKVTIFFNSLKLPKRL